MWLSHVWEIRKCKEWPSMDVVGTLAFMELLAVFDLVIWVLEWTCVPVFVYRTWMWMMTYL